MCWWWSAETTMVRAVLVGGTRVAKMETAFFLWSSPYSRRQVYFHIPKGPLISHFTEKPKDILKIVKKAKWYRNQIGNDLDGDFAKHMFGMIIMWSHRLGWQKSKFLTSKVNKWPPWECIASFILYISCTSLVTAGMRGRSPVWPSGRQCWGRRHEHRLLIIIVTLWFLLWGESARHRPFLFLLLMNLS